MEAPLPCFARSSSCIHRDRTNLYKTVLARSWWHCGQWQKNLFLLQSCSKLSKGVPLAVDFNFI